MHKKRHSCCPGCQSSRNLMRISQECFDPTKAMKLWADHVVRRTTQSKHHRNYKKRQSNNNSDCESSNTDDDDDDDDEFEK